MTCECEITTGVGIHLVGLADISLKETLLRTLTAMESLGYRCPGKKVIINLAPADLRKIGCGYDLPVALAIIAASQQEALPDLDKYVVAGELSLDGHLREIPGWLQCALVAKESGKCCILPTESAKLAARALQGEVTIYGADDLREVIDILNDGAPDTTALDDVMGEEPNYPEVYDLKRNWWDELLGHETEKRALEIAAAGGHPILLIGVPGSGKAEIAHALLNILPPMTESESLEVQGVYSVADKRIVPGLRPFRAPNYLTSLSALLGGGGYAKPGEVSLAHNGVLFFEHCAEAPKLVMVALRGPLEDGHVTLMRPAGKDDFPAKFFPVFAALPCPCGYYGEGDRCTCSPGQRQVYLARNYRTIYDSLTMQVWAHTPTASEIQESKRDGEPAPVVAERVRKAREIQMKRQNKLNEELSTQSLDTIAKLDDESKEILENIITRKGLSVRAYTRILKIARTIADLDGVEEILPHHIAEASTYRSLDRWLI
ncbi:MAG: YifB family Mg chelatase-like AAA ATPase [Lachnospiraceae bacterium]|nr:YifB family Mg chelatase-like AAA ATPase [Lachnospiraceae bacterium]